MSKDITVSEGNISRAFGNTKKLETRLQGEGSCFWVPEDETEAQSLYVTENGMYEASAEKVYGYSEVHVNIHLNVTDDDGTDWDIHIKDEVPHITIDDPDDPDIDPDDVPDISIDDITGDIDVHIPGGDPIDWPGWDDLDPDLKLDFEEWLDDPQDPDDWPKDPDDWPGWDDLDPEMKTDFDDWTADVDTQIDPVEMDLDPEQDMDVSYDPDEQKVDMIGTDGDGETSMVEFDPKTGEIDKTVLPDSIAVETPPTFTGPYGDGAYISFTGLTVAAYGVNGNKMMDVPFSELVFPVKVTDYSQAEQGKAIRTLNGKSVEGTRSIASTQYYLKGQDWVLNRSTIASCNAYALIIKVNGVFTAVSDTITAVYYQNGSDGEYIYREAERGASGFTNVDVGIGTSDITNRPMYRGIPEGSNWTDSGSWSTSHTPDLTNAPYSMREAADIALHGEGETLASQYVPVLWMRPGDGAVLETGFYVEVVDVSP